MWRRSGVRGRPVYRPAVRLWPSRCKQLEFGRGQASSVAGCRAQREKVVDDFGMTLGCPRRDFLAGRVAPCRQPVSHRDPVGIDVFASVDNTEQAPYLSPCIPTAAAHFRRS